MHSGKSDDVTQSALASASIDAARRLRELCAQFKAKECEQRTTLTYATIDDQVSRFQIWRGNLGALQRLPSTTSLDYRLRDTPRIASQILKLLQDLRDAVVESERLPRFCGAVLIV
jgi:hypothetical protein